VATPASSRKTALAVGLARLRRPVRRALVIVLSDFLTPEPVGLWREAARRHEVVALRFIDPREETLPSAGLIDLEDAEQGTRRVIDSGSAGVRAAYAKEAANRRMAYRRWCAGAGLTGYEIATTDDPIGPLIRIFSGRAAHRGGP
jgi:uncharacterized protein (DUF58 family)